MSENFKIMLPYVEIKDPHLCTDAHALLSIRRLLFPGLLRHDGQKAEGVLCSKWNVEDEGRVWKFTLKKGLTFTNGRELQAEDVVYSLKRAASPEIEGQLFTITYNEYFGNAIITALDDYTVKLENPEPISDLADFLADLAIIPRGWQSYEDGVGAGAYELLDHGTEKVTLKRRAGISNIPEVLELIAEPDSQKRAGSIAEAKADLALDPPLHMLNKMENSSGVEVLGWDTSLSVVFFVECTAPYLKDVRVRQALNYAVDKNCLIDKVVFGHAKPLNGPFSDRHLAHDPELEPYPYDPEKAKQLLTEARMDKNFELTINAPVIIPSEGPGLASFLAESFENIGINVTVKLHDDRTEYARQVAEKELHGVFCFDSSPLSSYKVLHEKIDSRFAGTWWQGYHNTDVNSLITEAVSTSDDTKRQATYRKAYKILRKEAPWIYLYQARRFWIMRSGAEQAPRFDNLGFFIAD